MNDIKTIDELSNIKVKDIVTINYKTAEVLEKYKIDFCCNGNISLNEVLRDRESDKQKIVDELLSVIKNETVKSENFNDWGILELINYIVDVHHKYVLEAVPRISSFLDKVVEKHGSKYQYLTEIKLLFNQLSKELENHMMKEERILFPYMKYLVECQKFNEKPKTSGFGSINNPIRQMEVEHDSAGNILHKLRYLTNDYKLPDDACTTFSLVYEELKEFEKDMHKHIHLENYILFPKSIELEKNLLKQN